MSDPAPEISKLTERYQTTVPSSVRKRLRLNKGDRIRYCTDASGRVYIEADREDEDDPALGAFLALIEADVRAHPERLRAFDGALRDRLEALVAEVEIEMDAPLSTEDE